MNLNTWYIDRKNTEAKRKYVITNPKQVEILEKLLNDEKIENNNSLYEVSMYE